MNSAESRPADKPICFLTKYINMVWGECAEFGFLRANIRVRVLTVNVYALMCLFILLYENFVSSVTSLL
jgi:hypothetical protein